jgi:hypothetical protein
VSTIAGIFGVVREKVADVQGLEKVLTKLRCKGRGTSRAEFTPEMLIIEKVFAKSDVEGFLKLIETVTRHLGLLCFK